MDGSVPQPSLRDRFITGMSHAAATVNIVTTDGMAGRAGVTVSAMSSVSADTPKPTLLVCVHHKSSAAAKIIENGVFCVNVLRDDQSYISDTFAGRFAETTDKFACAEWATQVTGSPRVIDPLVAFDCRIVSKEQVGTHYVFIGEVEDLFVAQRGSPLIYSNRAYGSAWRIDAAPTVDAGRHAAGRKLSLGCFHSFGPFVVPELIERSVRENTGIDIELTEGDQRKLTESLTAGQIELALLYDFDLPETFATEQLTQLHPYVLLADGHPLTKKPDLRPSDLAEHVMVLLDTPPSRDYFPRLMSDAGYPPKIGFRSISFEMVRGLVGHGLGYALLATKPAASVTYDGQVLVARPFVTEAEPSRVVLAHRHSVPLSDAAERFRILCRESFGVS